MFCEMEKAPRTEDWRSFWVVTLDHREIAKFKNGKNSFILCRWKLVWKMQLNFAKTSIFGSDDDEKPYPMCQHKCILVSKDY